MSKALELAEMIEGVRAPYCGAAATELRRLAAVEAERDALKAKLDICLRYAQGEAEDPALLANDYGGLGYEKDPACLAVGAIALELERIRAMEPVAEIVENRYGGRATKWLDNQKAATMPFGTALYTL